MRVAIVGSRKYTNKRRVQEFIFKLLPKAPAWLAVYSPTAAEPVL